MNWTVELHPSLAGEIRELPESVRAELMASLELLKSFGPNLGRPYVDTLKGSKFSNMKELRFQTQRGVWRSAFAFDRRRVAIVLVAADKRGQNS